MKTSNKTLFFLIICALTGLQIETVNAQVIY